MNKKEWGEVVEPFQNIGNPLIVRYVEQMQR